VLVFWENNNQAGNSTVRTALLFVSKVNLVFFNWIWSALQNLS